MKLCPSVCFALARQAASLSRRRKKEETLDSFTHSANPSDRREDLRATSAVAAAAASADALRSKSLGRENVQNVSAGRYPVCSPAPKTVNRHLARPQKATRTFHSFFIFGVFLYLR
jgi:hypothetical protein